MEETYLLNVEGVRKKILHGGQGELPKLQDGSKITFHFQTLKDDFERTVIDDSREAGIPMEIIVGKMFKLEIWETLLSSMRTGEVAEFWCDAIHTGMYALVSRGMRRIAEGRDPLEGQKHRCGMGNMFDYHSTGYDDLDELQRTPQPLIFIMELFRVEEPSAYKRDTWAMSKEEKLAAVPVLHREGNRLVLRKEFAQAAAKYQEAVICLRNLQAKEKPWEEGWLKLERLVTPLVLNYCQCQLELGEYYEVLEHTTELLQKHKDNAKAYFKRAKAHAAVWNEREAREDFLRVAHLDPSMAAAVKKELKQLGERMRKKHVEDRKRYQGLFQPPRGPQASKGQENGEVLQEGAPHGEVGVPETPGQREWGAGMGEAEQPGAGQAEQATPRAEGEGAAPGDVSQGQAAEVEGRGGTAVGEEENLGTSRAEPGSWGTERGAEEGGEKEEREGEEEEGEKREKEEDGGEGKEKKTEEDKESPQAEKEERKEEGKKMEEEGKEDRGEGKEEEDSKKETPQAEKKEEGKEEEEEGEKGEKMEEEVKEDREEENERKAEEDTEEESRQAELHELPAGHCGAARGTEAAGLGQGLEQGARGALDAGTGTMGRAEPGRAPGLDEAPGEVLAGGSSREQAAGAARGEGAVPTDSFPAGAVDGLHGGAGVPPCPTAAREGGDAPPGPCSESRELGASPEQGHSTGGGAAVHTEREAPGLGHGRAVTRNKAVLSLPPCPDSPAPAPAAGHR